MKWKLHSCSTLIRVTSMFYFSYLDFTINKFLQLSDAVAKNYSTITMSEYLCSENLPEKFALIRHDVDRMPENSLNTARLENELGIRATYYFRSVKNVFIPEIITEISNLGHEIGYHYEVLSEAGGNYDKAIDLFKLNLKEFRNICDIKTICMHGCPLSKYDNRDLWKIHDFKDFEILGEAYLSVGTNLNYFSDTGRCWGFKNSIRDFIPGNTVYFSIEATDELIKLVESRKLHNLYILIHPERWSPTLLGWCLYCSRDFGANLLKKFLRGLKVR